MTDYQYDRRVNPFRPAARGYHANNALCLACAANLVYLDEATIAPTVQGWGFSQRRRGGRVRSKTRRRDREEH